MPSETKQDFLSLLDLTPEQLHGLIDRAQVMKDERRRIRPFVGRTLAMIFTKASTRTRVSFETAMAQLGGHALFLSPNDTQLGRGEPIEDTARVIGRMCDGVMIRNDSHSDQQLFAEHSQAPVINGLSDLLHPCQLLADVLTIVEHKGHIDGLNVAWVGDGNNVCHSFAHAAKQFGFNLRVASPNGYAPDSAVMVSAGDAVQISDSAAAACDGADVVVTDVWASMGQEAEQAAREQAFAGYQVDENLMTKAKPDALFMHCLPAHRGEEVVAEVIDGPQSVVWDEAENRLHAQKALLELLLD